VGGCAVEGCYSICVNLDARDYESHLREGYCQREADIALSDHGNARGVLFNLSL
jgi:hypothetical protein